MKVEKESSRKYISICTVGGAAGGDDDENDADADDDKGDGVLLLNSVGMLLKFR